VTLSLGTLSAALFSPLVGEECRLGSPDHTAVAVTLAQCREYPRSTIPGSARTAFSLIFTCPEDTVGGFTGGPCVLTHPILAEIEPFHVERILAVGYPAGTVALQALFN
jgi:hypothetical protein